MLFILVLAVTVGLLKSSSGWVYYENEQQ
jgi:hypothetical protein